MLPNLQKLLSKALSPRLVTWLIASMLLLISIAVISPQQLTVVLYKITLVTIASVMAYWLDRGLFPYARPHTMHQRSVESQQSGCRDADILDRLSASLAGLRRALIVLACVLGLTLGL